MPSPATEHPQPGGISESYSRHRFELHLKGGCSSTICGVARGFRAFRYSYRGRGNTNPRPAPTAPASSSARSSRGAPDGAAAPCSLRFARSLRATVLPPMMSRPAVRSSEIRPEVPSPGPPADTRNALPSFHPIHWPAPRHPSDSAESHAGSEHPQAGRRGWPSPIPASSNGRQFAARSCTAEEVADCKYNCQCR